MISNMTELQKCVYDIFCTFRNICDLLGIKYYLMGGTLLGTVRHQGFIPWDDDIDVGIMREEYDVFLTKAQQLLPEYYFLQTYKTDPGYPLGIAKIRDSRTTFIESQLNKLSINHGVYIDVFPLDYYPEISTKQILLDFKRNIYKYRIRQQLHFEDGKHSKIAEAVASVLGKLISLKYPNVSDAVDARDRLYSGMPKSRLIANYYGAWKKKEIVPADWYGEGVPLTFEGVVVRAPKEYKKWLEQVYGNYMELPPVEKRVSHHNIDVIDIKNPYTMYF